MKILDNIFQKLHENYVEKVKIERGRIKDWTNEQIKGYLDSYYNHGPFWNVFIGEPPIIEACIEVYGQRVTNNLYLPPN